MYISFGASFPPKCLSEMVPWILVKYPVPRLKSIDQMEDGDKTDNQGNCMLTTICIAFMRKALDHVVILPILVLYYWNEVFELKL